jgi:calcineurin-like phosphoesterase family protein
MSVFVIGDPHFGHRNIAKFRPFVTSPEDNEKKICDEWRKRVHKRGIVYVMGDASFTNTGLDLIASLPGKKILIKGNHDDIVSTNDQMTVFDEIHGMLKYKGMWFSHAPIHPDELRGKPNVHGHVHAQSIMKKTWYGRKVLDPRYLNTCPDFVYPKWGKFILTLDEVKAYFKGQWPKRTPNQVMGLARRSPVDPNSIIEL